ncbi:phosphotransferase [Staphylospora marina]|uniref:phosphotransferase n=1 Tax=Staphylospora marina TaxID=2490858 RepID=UPI000F5BB384|nr:phosphotransferase [Staphylospora marina]
MNLSDVFKKKFFNQQLLQEDDGYITGGSHVWLAQTDEGEVIVRTSAITDLEKVPYWYGNHILFGIDPRRVFVLEKLNRELASMTTRLSVPQVLDKASLQGHEYVIVEKLPGKALDTFRGMPDHLMEDFGASIAHIHLRSFDYFGDVSGSTRKPLTDFHECLIACMTELVEKFYSEPDDKSRGIRDMLPEICQQARLLPAPSSSSFVMMDTDPSQFLTDGERVTAVVDTESYVIAPRELELLTLEMIFDEQATRSFKKGYARVLEFPDLSTVRTVYRYFLRLVETQGSRPMDEWMNHPALFG